MPAPEKEELVEVVALCTIHDATDEMVLPGNLALIHAAEVDELVERGVVARASASEPSSDAA